MFQTFPSSAACLMLLVSVSAVPTSKQPQTTTSPSHVPSISSARNVSSQATARATGSVTFPASGCVTNTGIPQTVSGFPPHYSVATNGLQEVPLPSSSIPFCLCQDQTVATLALYVDVQGSAASTLCAATAAPRPTDGEWRQVSYGPDPSSVNWTASYFTKPTDKKCSGAESVDPACWTSLGMNDYVQWWWQAHKDFCGDDTGFADCFMKRAGGRSMSGCSSMTASGCSDPDWNDYKDSFNGARDWYVAANIYAISNYFRTYYNAWTAATLAVSDTVGTMVQLINPQHDGEDKKDDWKFAMDILSIPMGLASLIPLEAEWSKLMMEGVKLATEMTTELVPETSPDKPNVGEQFLDFANVTNTLSARMNEAQTRLSKALNVALNDADSFAKMTSTTAFSYDMKNIIDQDKMKGSIVTVLNTFVASQLYQLTEHVLTRAVDTSVVDLQHNGSSLNWDTGCDRSYGSYSECDNFYYHDASHTTYGLVKAGDNTVNFNGQMQTLFNGPTTGELLFHNAALCTDPSKVDPLNPDASLACLSTIKVCTWNMNPSDPDHFVATTDCEDIFVGHSPRPDLIVQATDGAIDDSEDFYFPNAYLGSMIHGSNGNVRNYFKGVEAPPLGSTIVSPDM